MRCHDEGHSCCTPFRHNPWIRNAPRRARGSVFAPLAPEVTISNCVESLAVCICQINTGTKTLNFADFALMLKKFQALERLMIVPLNLEGRILQAEWPGYNMIGPTEKGRWEHNRRGWWFVERPHS
jgi:hypothetical protein